MKFQIILLLSLALKVSVHGQESMGEKKSMATRNANVYIFSNNFKIPQLNRERRIWVYLPPNYKATSKKFSVLYMHDGQNVFDALTAYSEEWEVDETLNRLSENIGLDLIVVGIDNGGKRRLNEYSPWENSQFGNAEGSAYVDFIVKTLKPIIDKTYRTKTSAKHTGIMGSSMGGLISHYAGLKYPKVFGKVGVFSPSFWYSKKSFEFTYERSKLKGVKMYYLVGTKEGGNMVSDMRDILNLMKENGFRKNNLFEKVVPDATHNELFWRSEFESAIKWLFNK